MKIKDNNRVGYVMIAFVFCLSRVVFHDFGVRFDSNPLVSYLQFIDPFLLKNNFLQSIFYLHCQPPLFNLFLGIILKVFPENYALVFNVIYLLCGIIFAGAIYTLMLRMKVYKSVAMFLTITFMISPAVILYEKWLYYSYPIATLLVLTALFLNKYAVSNDRRFSVLFFSCLGMIVLINSTFHLFWFVLIGVVLVFFKRGYSKSIILSGLIPLLIIIGVYTKNYFISGSFGTSSTWFGVQVAAMIIPNLNKHQQELFLKDQSITHTMLGEDPTQQQMESVSNQALKKTTKIPILDLVSKPSIPQMPNFNSLIILGISKLYLKEALYVLKQDLRLYVIGVIRSCLIYFFPGPTDVRFDNRKVIAPYENIYNFMFFHLNRINSNELYTAKLFQTHLWNLNRDFFSSICFALVIGYYILLIIFCCKFIKNLFNSNKNHRFLTMLFIFINIIYVSLISILLGYWATNRYRFSIDAFYLIIFGVFLTHLIKKFKSILRLNRLKRIVGSAVNSV